MEPYDTVRRYADMWTVNDLTGVFDSYHDDFVLHYFGNSPLAGDHVGKDPAIPLLVEATQRSGRQLDQIEDVLSGDTFGAIVAREESDAAARPGSSAGSSSTWSATASSAAPGLRSGSAGDGRAVERATGTDAAAPVAPRRSVAPEPLLAKRPDRGDHGCCGHRAAA